VCGERAAPEPIIGGSTGSCCITQVALAFCAQPWILDLPRVLCDGGADGGAIMMEARHAAGP
jgi:hypothetical protein